MSYDEFLSVARQTVSTVLPEVRKLLEPYGLDIEENPDYDWNNSPGAVAVYEAGSVFEKTIVFALNLPYSFEIISDTIAEIGGDDPYGDVCAEISVSIWHEAIHGLWEYMDDLLWNDAQIRRRAYANPGTVKTVDAFREDEEETVEQCARWLSERGLNTIGTPGAVTLLLNFHKAI